MAGSVAMSGAPFLGSWEPLPGLLRDYELLWTPTTDAPRVYHVAAGLAVIATVVESRVYLPFGGDRLYPNLWMLILGPSSFYRKSTALAKARKTLGRLYEQGQSPLLPDEFSREALLKRLSERAQGLLTYSEFSGALATFGRDYMSGTKELLADLYDSPETYTRIVGQQTWTLNNVCLSILGASQTDWFIEKLKQGDVRGGFLARFSYWPAFEKPRFMAVPAEPNREIHTRLLAGLNQLRNVRGAASFAPGVEATYAKWVEAHERELHRSPHLGELSPFWSRLSIITLKIAMLLQLAHNRELEISPAAMTSALSLTDFLKASLAHLFAEEFAFTKPMQDRQKLLRLVRKHPDGISRRDLMRASSMLARDFEAVVSTLQQEELIVSKGRVFFPADSSAESVQCQQGVH
jgi:hypothetical protein